MNEPGERHITPSTPATGDAVPTDPAVIKPTPKGIGGWLLLVVLGLVIAPLRVVHLLATQHVPMLRDGAWGILTTPGTELYHPLWAPLIVFEVVGNLGSIALALATLWLMFRKSRHTPRVAIAWLAWSTAIVVIDFILGQQIPMVAAQSGPDETRELTRALVSSAIWIPYFLVSKRVKATFVE
jgi:hypothetical protein